MDYYLYHVKKDVPITPKEWTKFLFLGIPIIVIIFVGSIVSIPFILSYVIYKGIAK